MGQSRLGKLHHSKEGKIIFVGTNGLTMCGHQHTSARAAKNCIANLKRSERINPSSHWRVQAYFPTADGLEAEAA